MELTIDSKPCDLAGEPIAVGGYAAAELADVEAAREGRSQEFTLPATPRNEALLGFARDPHTSGRFNASLHRAVLSAEGAKLLAGTVRLLKVSDDPAVLLARLAAAEPPPAAKWTGGEGRI